MRSASSKKPARAGRVVRRTNSAGQIVEYHYGAYTAPKPEQARQCAHDALGQIMDTWQRSPEWRGLSKGTHDIYVRAMVDLRGFGAVPIGNITRLNLLQTRNAIEQTRGPGAARCFVIGVSALFAFARQYGMIQITPTTGLAKGLKSGELPAWTEEDYALAIRHLPEYLRRIVVLARYTGQRRSDLITMKWSDYDGTRIHVTQVKTGVELDIPAGPQLKAELAAWRGLPAQPIITRPNGLPWVGANVSKVLGRELEKIPGFPKGYNLHGLRKLTATALVMAGATFHEVMSITGHKTPTMVMHYTKSVNQRQLADRVHMMLERPA